VAREWRLTKLQEKNAFVCGQSVCDTSARRATLTRPHHRAAAGTAQDLAVHRAPSGLPSRDTFTYGPLGFAMPGVSVVDRRSMSFQTRARGGSLLPSVSWRWRAALRRRMSLRQLAPSSQVKACGSNS
jgi:hypothetical protein